MSCYQLLAKIQNGVFFHRKRLTYQWFLSNLLLIELNQQKIKVFHGWADRQAQLLTLLKLFYFSKTERHIHRICKFFSCVFQLLIVLFIIPVNYDFCS